MTFPYTMCLDPDLLLKRFSSDDSSVSVPDADPVCPRHPCPSSLLRHLVFFVSFCFGQRWQTCRSSGGLGNRVSFSTVLLVRRETHDSVSGACIGWRSRCSLCCLCDQVSDDVDGGGTGARVSAPGKETKQSAKDAGEKRKAIRCIVGVDGVGGKAEATAGVREVDTSHSYAGLEGAASASSPKPR